MFSHVGMTGQPVYDSEGNFVDVEITTDSGGRDRSGQSLGHEADFTENADGSLTHAYQDYQDPEDPSVTGFDWDAYALDVAGTTPGLEDAIDFLGDGIGDEVFDEWNALLEVDNPTDQQLERFHQLKDQILQLYEEHGPAEGSELAGTENNVPYEPPSEEEFNTAMESLTTQEPEPDLADEWSASAHEYLAAGDEVAAAVSEAAAMFHRGEHSAEVLIHALGKHYDHDELARAYRMLQG